VCGPFVARAGQVLAQPARVSCDSLGELQEARRQREGVNDVLARERGFVGCVSCDIA
jgi:hypothetical protein